MHSIHLARFRYFPQKWGFSSALKGKQFVDWSFLIFSVYSPHQNISHSMPDKNKFGIRNWNFNIQNLCPHLVCCVKMGPDIGKIQSYLTHHESKQHRISKKQGEIFYTLDAPGENIQGCKERYKPKDTRQGNWTPVTEPENHLGYTQDSWRKRRLLWSLII